MSPPTGRVLALLELLQTLPGATATELAGRLSVDERTVRRDAAHLCDLGIPVRARRGRHGGFRLDPGQRGHRLPPLMLTEAEAVAVVVGLAAATRVGLSTGANGDAASASALTKIRRLLPETLASGVGSMLAALGLGMGERPEDRQPTAIILMLAVAAHQRRRVTLGYGGVERSVDPYEITFNRDQWRLTGFDHGLGGVWTFDLDQIEEVRPSAVTFGSLESIGEGERGRGRAGDGNDEDRGRG